MGLDIVEYVIALEDAFAIEIPDADAAHLETPARVIDYLCHCLVESPSGPPLLQSAFYWLRRGIAEELELPRQSIHTWNSVAQLTQRTAADVWGAVAGRLATQPTFLYRAPAIRWLSRLTGGQDRTLGEIARSVAMEHPHAFKRDTDGWTRAQITEVVLLQLERTIGRRLGPTELHLEFVRDLGLD